MGSRSAPDQDAHSAALSKAWEELSCKDPNLLAEAAGAALAAGRLTMRHFCEECIVDIAWRSVSFGPREAPPYLAVLALHYVAGCGSASPSGHLITFRELPGGGLYYSAFRSRSIDPLASAFCSEPGLLLKAGTALCGSPSGISSASIRLSVFPKLPVTVVVWQGDDEVPGGANILFDDLAPSILPTEDVAVVGSIVCSRLLRASRGLAAQQADRDESG